jgi:hypothetical protein
MKKNENKRIPNKFNFTLYLEQEFSFSFNL